MKVIYDNGRLSVTTDTPQGQAIAQMVLDAVLNHHIGRMEGNTSFDTDPRALGLKRIYDMMQVQAPGVEEVIICGDYPEAEDDIERARRG